MGSLWWPERKHPRVKNIGLGMGKRRDVFFMGRSVGLGYVPSGGQECKESRGKGVDFGLAKRRGSPMGTNMRGFTRKKPGFGAGKRSAVLF